MTTSSILGNPTYRRLFGAQVVALVGTGLATVALTLLAHDLAPTRAGAVVGTVLTLKILAYVAVAPVASALVARLPTRTVLVGCDVVRAGAAACLPWVDQAWQVYVLVVVLQAASATFTPAFQAAIPRVLPDEAEYTRALSLSRLAYDLESVLSPLLAGLLLVVVPFHGLFAGTAIGFVLSALLVTRSRVPTHRPTARPASFGARTLAGVRLFLDRPPLRALLALDLAVAAATAMVLVNTVVLVEQESGRGDVSVATALAVFGAGSMVVALALPRVLRRTGDRPVMLAGGIGSAVALGLTALVTQAQDPWLPLLATWFLSGAATSLALTPSGRVLTRAAGPDDGPAAFAAHFSLSHAWYLVTYPVAGWVGGFVGVTASAIVLAVVAAAGALAAIVAWVRDPSDPHRVVAGST